MQVLLAITSCMSCLHAVVHAVCWVHGAGCVPGQGATRQDGGASTLLVPPAPFLLETYQGETRWLTSHYGM